MNTETYVTELTRIISKYEFHLFRLYKKLCDKLPSDPDACALGSATLVQLKTLRNLMKENKYGGNSNNKDELDECR